MKRIGLITYHAAYNFGSVLQAYATQEILRKLNYNCTIINYRPYEQKYYYGNHIRLRYGARTILKDFSRFYLMKKRIIMSEKYEKFITNNLNITKEVNSPDEAINLMNKFNLIISGSDQIWNKYSNELYHCNWKYMYPYTLNGYTGKKISYASSIGNMDNPVDLNILAKLVNDFSSISFRENSSAILFSQFTKKNISIVVDPTFLLSVDEWIKKLRISKIRKNMDYILYYSLSGIKEIYENIKLLKSLSKKFGKKIIIIAPMCPILLDSKEIEFHPEYSPIDFLIAIYNSDMVITDSYHGTVLSINFQKNFYSLCKKKRKSDIRKFDILKQIGLENQIIETLLDIEEEKNSIDYRSVIKIIDELKSKSINYLYKSIEN